MNTLHEKAWHALLIFRAIATGDCQDAAEALIIADLAFAQEPTPPPDVFDQLETALRMKPQSASQSASLAIAPADDDQAQAQARRASYGRFLTDAIGDDQPAPARANQRQQQRMLKAVDDVLLSLKADVPKEVAAAIARTESRMADMPTAED